MIWDVLLVAYVAVVVTLMAASAAQYVEDDEYPQVFLVLAWIGAVFWPLLILWSLCDATLGGKDYD